jgi:putative DNA primase/helicase
MFEESPKDCRALLAERGADALLAAVMDAEPIETPAAKPAPVSLLRFQDSDAGNAERFHALHGANVRHVAESGQWLLWNGARWQPDTTRAVVRMFVETMRQFAREAVSITNAEAAQSRSRFALRSTNGEKVKAGLEMAKAVEGITISVTELDCDPWLVGTADGVIDLRQGTSTTPRREQLITKSMATSYDAGADCPRWLKFLDTVTGGDGDLASYLQAAVGYALTGITREQCLFFLYGTGCNGKGVFSETIKRLFADYAQTAPETLFTRDRNSSATNDIARLAGCRLAIASELDEGAAFAESRIKSLTGGDTVTARFLHQEFFDFAPSHKFFISGNHKPSVRGTDTGIWRRIRLVPFTVRIPDAEKDPALAEKLADELPGILNWALAGCLRWQRHGLTPPACVTQATAEYRREEDVIGQFLDDCTTVDAGARIGTTALYQTYEEWCVTEGIRQQFRLSARKLNRRIEEHGFHRIKSGGAWLWDGLEISINADFGDSRD